MHYSRYIEPYIASRLQSTPILIVEGARSVGKTHLLRTLEKRRIIAPPLSLLDPSVLSAARENPGAWLRGLPQPFAIDEAQLAPELPLALKALLDERGEDLHGILTGSAAIGQTGLGGSDPLARRSQRIGLEPLTEAELRRAPAWSLIDAVFDAVPRTGATQPAPDWRDRVIRGGIPRYRVDQEGRSLVGLQREIREGMDSVLTQSVLPGERFDLRLASRVVEHALRNPSTELKAKTIANALELDARTVNRYLDIGMQRFLIHELPNLQRSHKQSARASAKTYPADTALSAALLLSGRPGEFPSDQVKGGLMEAHVVQQFRAHAGWAELSTELHHWRSIRNGRSDEVDLVLQDATGRLVGIEIKAGSSNRADDFTGIRQLRAKHPDQFHRGFVIVAEGAVTPVDDSGTLWRIPLSALEDLTLWDTADLGTSADGPSPSHTPWQENTPMEHQDAQVFMSYAHADQTSIVGGDPRRFAQDIVDAVEALHDRTVRLFTDTEDGSWGEILWDRLDQELEASTFLLPFITPRYLKSEGCRREFTRFKDAADRRTSDQRILPLLWIPTHELSKESPTDPVIASVQKLRYRDVGGARISDRATREYREAVELAADALNQVMTEAEGGVSATVQDDDAPASRDAGLGLTELLEKIEREMPDMTESLHRFGKSLGDVGAVFSSSLQLEEDLTPSQLMARLTDASHALAAPSGRLESASAELTERWQSLVTHLNAASRQSDLLGRPIPASFVSDMRSIPRSIEEIPLTDMELYAQQMPLLSARLNPTSRALLSAIEAVRTIASSAHDFIDANT